jgi:DNA-binding response OmpR family regulator
VETAPPLLHRRGWFVAGPLAARDDASEVHLDGSRIELTPAQQLVLVSLLRRNGRLARRAELYEEAFGRPLPMGSRAVDQHIAKIRAALGPAGGCIVTVGRVGYRLDPVALAKTAL